MESITIKGTQCTPELIKELRLPVIPAGVTYLSQNEYLTIIADYIDRKYGHQLKEIYNMQETALEDWRIRFEIERLTENQNSCSSHRNRKPIDNMIIGFVLRISNHREKLKERKLYLNSIPNLDSIMNEMIARYKAEVEKEIAKAKQIKIVKVEREEFLQSLHPLMQHSYVGSDRFKVSGKDISGEFSIHEDINTKEEIVNIHIRTNRAGAKRVARMFKS